jgi:hypothetical protein
MYGRVAQQDAPTLVKIMVLANLCTAIGVVAVGVLSFISIQFSEIITSLYVVIFGVLFICFFVGSSLKIGSLESFLMENVGFMFTWQGRLLFFGFIASLCFQLGLDGQIVGGIALAVVIFNIYVMCTNSAYFDKIKEDSKIQRAHALGQMAQGRSFGDDMKAAAAVGQVAVSIANNPVAAQIATSAYNSSAQSQINELDSDPNWEKNHDEHTGNYFYVNKFTNETRWVD